MRSRIGRFELPSFFEDTGEPGTDVVGAAALRVPPDRSQIIAVKIMWVMLHGVTSLSQKNVMAQQLEMHL